MVILNGASLTVECEGFLEDSASKTARVVTEATNGTKDETYTRVMDEYDLIITNMSSANYAILKDLYKFENSFTIKDTKRVIEDGQFFFDMDTLKLTPVEDKRNSTFIYTGNLALRKV